jgi:hypothetical protein
MMKVRKQGSLPKSDQVTVSQSGILCDSGEIHLIPKVLRISRTKLPTSTLFLVFFTAESQVWVAHDQRFGVPGFPGSRDFMTIHNVMIPYRMVILRVNVMTPVLGTASQNPRKAELAPTRVPHLAPYSH